MCIPKSSAENGIDLVGIDKVIVKFGYRYPIRKYGDLCMIVDLNLQ